MQRAQETRASESGFAMAALLVAMAVMAVVMSVLLPVWHTLSVREKEEELMWRGQQYDRAIQLFRKKNAAPGPPNVDALIRGRFLRKKFKDPITNDDFEFVGVNAGQPTMTGGPSAPGAPGAQRGPGASGMQQQRPPSQPPRGFGQLIGSVRSKSKKHSFREPDGATTYDQWQFSYVPWKPASDAVPQIPGGQGMPGMSGGRGGPGARPGAQGPRSGPGGQGTGPGRQGQGGTTRGPGSGVVVPVDTPAPPPIEP
jgi:type II secretory pathway pseudopilin PulG